MEEEDVARKIGALLRESESALSPEITKRLAQCRQKAMRQLVVQRSEKKHTGFSIALPLAAGLSGLVLLGLAAVIWLGSQSTFPLDEALQTEVLPVRAFVDNGFKPWTAPVESSDEGE